MKKISWLLSILFFSSCSNADIPAVETESQTYESGKSYRLGEPESEINLKILEIYDSRCSKDAICIWYGYAAVKFEVSIGTRSFTDSLYTPAYANLGLYKTKEFLAEGRKYSITLKDVIPFPCAACEKPAKQKAILNISPL